MLNGSVPSINVHIAYKFKTLPRFLSFPEGPSNSLNVVKGNVVFDWSGVGAIFYIAFFLAPKKERRILTFIKNTAFAILT